MENHQTNFWGCCRRPIVALAPMDGYSDSAFRQICKRINSDLITYTEFTSADGISHRSPTVMRKLAFTPQEQPILAQLFGKSVENMVTAAKICADLGFSGIDLNMGCPSKKVVKSEHGVALRRNPALACELITAVRNATGLPVSVKTRLGWVDASDLIAFGKRVENAGASMICIHARTYAQPYRVPAQFEWVYELRRELTIPVIGNGGILNYADGLTKQNNLDGFMIGQASFGNPWVFDASGATPKFSEKIPIIFAHADALFRDKGARVASREIRKHLLKYVSGFAGASQFRRQLATVETQEDIRRIISEIDITHRPVEIESVSRGS